jgi:two-component sensor histidine kinase
LIFFALDALLHISGQGVILAVFAVAVAIVLAFPPLRERSQLWIDRLLFREKYDSRQMLQELSQTVASLLGFDELTATILDKVTTTMGIGKISLLLEDAKTGGFHVAVQRGVPEDAARLMLRKDHPLVHYLSREWLLTWQDIEVLPQFKALWGQEKEDLAKLGAELFVPLKVKGKLVGTFAVGPKLSGETYSPDDQLTLATLANQTVVAIENARLYSAAQQELAERKRAEEQIKAALAEKEILLREVHHRVKNNLQAIIALISMQAEQIGDARTTQSLKELQERAYTMALVYEQLYQSENLAQIPMKPYLQDLSAHVFQAFGGGRAIKLSVEATPVSLDVETALPCGLIVNELLTNALKYSFPGGSKDGAEVQVEFRAEAATYTLVVSDNGVGLPPGLDWRKARTMGLRLVSFWATHQLGGKLEVDNRQGTTFQITFGEQPKRQRPG